MVLDDQIQAAMYILHMFHWVDQAFIVVQTHIHGKVVLRESSLQYVFVQRRKPPLLGTINIPLGVLEHRLFLALCLLSS